MVVKYRIPRDLLQVFEIAAVIVQSKSTVCEPVPSRPFVISFVTRRFYSRFGVQRCNIVQFDHCADYSFLKYRYVTPFDTIPVHSRDGKFSSMRFLDWKRERDWIFRYRDNSRWREGNLIFEVFVKKEKEKHSDPSTTNR